MIELTQKQAEKLASQTPVAPLTEAEIIEVVKSYIEDFPLTAALVAIGQRGEIKQLRKMAKEACQSEIERRKYQEWSRRACPQWDARRNRFIYYGLDKIE